MKSQKTYERFIEDDFNIIQEEFNKEKGLSVKTADDFSTYIGWKERNRKVKRGEKAVRVQSSQAYPQPLFSMGHPRLDEKGNQVFAKYQKDFFLFHYAQTNPLTL